MDPMDTDVEYNWNSSGRRRSTRALHEEDSGAASARENSHHQPLEEKLEKMEIDSESNETQHGVQLEEDRKRPKRRRSRQRKRKGSKRLRQSEVDEEVDQWVLAAGSDDVEEEAPEPAPELEKSSSDEDREERMEQKRVMAMSRREKVIEKENEVKGGDKEIDVEGALRRVRLPPGIRFDDLVARQRVELRQRLPFECGPELNALACPVCHSTMDTAHFGWHKRDFRLRYINNRRVPGVLQPRFLCTNSRLCRQVEVWFNIQPADSGRQLISIAKSARKKLLELGKLPAAYNMNTGTASKPLKSSCNAAGHSNINLASAGRGRRQRGRRSCKAARRAGPPDLQVSREVEVKASVAAEADHEECRQIQQSKQKRPLSSSITRKQRPHKRLKLDMQPAVVKTEGPHADEDTEMVPTQAVVRHKHDHKWTSLKRHHERNRKLSQNRHHELPRGPPAAAAPAPASNYINTRHGHVPRIKPRKALRFMRSRVLQRGISIKQRHLHEVVKRGERKKRKTLKLARRRTRLAEAAKFCTRSSAGRHPASGERCYLKDDQEKSDVPAARQRISARGRTIAWQNFLAAHLRDDGDQFMEELSTADQEESESVQLVDQSRSHEEISAGGRPSPWQNIVAAARQRYDDDQVREELSAEDRQKYAERMSFFLHVMARPKEEPPHQLPGGDLQQKDVQEPGSPPTSNNMESTVGADDHSTDYLMGKARLLAKVMAEVSAELIKEGGYENRLENIVEPLADDHPFMRLPRTREAMLAAGYDITKRPRVVHSMPRRSDFPDA